MSRLIDRLKRVSGVAPPPMGFKVVRESAEKSRILLIAEIMPDNLKKMADGVTTADAVVCRTADLESATKFAREMGRAFSGVPGGVWIGGNGPILESINDTALDFIVFPASAPLVALQKDRMGKVIEVNTSIEAVLLRAVNELSVDAVLLSTEPDKAISLTCESLLFIHLCAGLLEKALLASVPVDVSLDELKMLWEAGIGGVVVAIADEASQKKLADLRQEIDKATFPSRRRRTKTSATLPSVGGTAEVAEEQEEEEEEE